MTRCRRWICLICCLGPGAAGVQASTDIPATLAALQADALWGEVTLGNGRTRQVQVDSLTADSVSVREVVGALQLHPAAYALGDIRSVRNLGALRIPERLAPYQPPRSPVTALALESVVPGAGYFYTGDSRQGWSLLGFTALVGATAVGVGNDGLAGWLPLAAWVRVTSLANLYDQVQADAAARRARADGPRPRSGAMPLLQARLRF